MKRRIYITAFLTAMAVLFTGTAMAQERTFGLGLALGTPTTMSGKAFFTDEHALYFEAPYDLARNDPYISADYNFHFRDLIPGRKAWLRFYVGGGTVLTIDDHHHHHHYDDHGHDHDDELWVALHAVGGMSFLFHRVPFEISLHWAPGFWIAPHNGFHSNGVIGVRYFFM